MPNMKSSTPEAGSSTSDNRLWEKGEHERGEINGNEYIGGGDSD